MLFTYKYINHEIEKIQEILDFLFYEVWLVAEGVFDVEKLNKNPELKAIYIEFGNIDYDPANAEKNQKGKSAYFFNSSIENIFNEFAKINDDDFKLSLIDFYYYNNHIEELCCDKTKVPISYNEIKTGYPDLEKDLNNFYYKLYGKESPFNLKALGELNNTLLPSHYKEFMKLNDDEICPFCGIMPIKGNNHSYKDAYDHYLPKGIYPFNALNFKNLAPMCHECNSTYKLSKEPLYEDYKKIDPLLKEDKRQLAFYPYSLNHPKLEISIELKTKDVNNLTVDDVTLNVVADKHDEQIESWKRVFGIEERYLALICSKHSGKEWYVDVYEDFKNAKEVSDIEKAEDYYKKVIRATTLNNRLAQNALKRKFLEECKKSGLFDAKLEIDSSVGVAPN